MPQLVAVHHGVVGLHPGEAVPGHLAGLVTVAAQEGAQCSPPDLLQLAGTESGQRISIFIPKPKTNVTSLATMCQVSMN